MIKKNGNKIIILSGPSCVGKTPLCKALQKFYPQISSGLNPLVMYNSRPPRIKEKEGVDYFFHTKNYIDSLRNKKDFVVMILRGDTVALDIKQVTDKLKKNNVLFEGNPFAAKVFLTHKAFKHVEKVSVFLSPVSREEILSFKSMKDKYKLSEVIAAIMRAKLLRRTQKQKGILSLPDLSNIEVRAKSAYKELKLAYMFDHVIVNHDGEDSGNWEAFYHPLGEARASLLTFVEVIKGRKNVQTEHWGSGLVK